MTSDSQPDIPARLTRVVLGVTGGIAAYKAAELTRLLVKDGCQVDVVMTEAATRFVSATTFQALSGRPVTTDLWASGSPDAMGHISLSRGADAIMVAPASADFLAKLANGLADDLLSTLCVARECPLLVAPAMNRQMWDNAATQRNMGMLLRNGVVVLGPDAGGQACGEIGVGRMVAPEALFASLAAMVQPKVLAGKRVLLTAGPTFEAIDPVRGITNSSSGKMGFALAQAAAEAGAHVTLIAGPTAMMTPIGIHRLDVVSAAEMARVVASQLAGQDVFIGVAAVADYAPAIVATEKLRKNGSAIVLTLQPTVDILATVAAMAQPPFCVGFAAESHDVEARAEAKRIRKKLPLLIANRAQDAIGSDHNEVTLLDNTGAHPLPRMGKLELARRLVGEIAARLPH